VGAGITEAVEFGSRGASAIIARGVCAKSWRSWRPWRPYPFAKCLPTSPGPKNQPQNSPATEPALRRGCGLARPLNSHESSYRSLDPRPASVAPMLECRSKVAKVTHKGVAIFRMTPEALTCNDMTRSKSTPRAAMSALTWSGDCGGKCPFGRVTAFPSRRAATPARG
jgi:hypothetical protein